MPVFRLPSIPVFPHPFEAEPDGLLAVEGDLTPDWLITAYTFGIFPWFNPGEMPRWYAPIPRFGLFPDELHVSKSLRLLMQKGHFTVTINTAFEDVIRNCKDVYRPGQGGTWISDELESAFCLLHELGWALSVECWRDGELVGGLYGLAIGRIFCGESMFALESNASKVAFVHLVKFLKEHDFTFIDCQQETEHLARFGARLLSKKQYWDIIRLNLPVVLSQMG